MPEGKGCGCSTQMLVGTLVLLLVLFVVSFISGALGASFLGDLGMPSFLSAVPNFRMFLRSTSYETRRMGVSAMSSRASLSPYFRADLTIMSWMESMRGTSYSFIFFLMAGSTG